jgi:ATP-dependent 26S proteasome regulatory subunit
MSQTETFAIRPADRSGRESLQSTLRVYLNHGDIAARGLAPGTLCVLTKSTEPQSTALGLAWLATEKSTNKIIKVTEAFREMYGLNLGDRVSIMPMKNAVPYAKTIYLEVADGNSLLHGFSTMKKLTFRARTALASLPLLYCGVSIEIRIGYDRVVSKQERNFKISRVEAETEFPVFVCNESTKIIFLDCKDTEHVSPEAAQSFQMNRTSLYGLSEQLDLIDKAINLVFENSRLHAEDPWLQPTHGLIIHGPPGYGKSTITRRISEISWNKVFWISSRDFVVKNSVSEDRFERIFADAQACQPSMIAIDDIDRFGEDTPGGIPKVQKLLAQQMYNLKGAQVLVAITATNPLDISAQLRGFRAFSTEIALPKMDHSARMSWVKNSFSGTVDPQLLLFIAEKTSGFAPRDLQELCAVAGNIAYQRLKDEKHPSTYKIEEGDKLEGRWSVAPLLKRGDIEAARLAVHPTAMKGMAIKNPGVSWDDIGGVNDVRKALQKVISRPLLVSFRILSFQITYS